MKKTTVFIIAAMTAFGLSQAASAAETDEARPIEPQDIVFHPSGGGKYLFNNNPEGIDDMMIASGSDPRYISNHDGLEPDMYYLYMSYFNYTGGGGRGYDIEVDVRITAEEDAVITIRNASFETNEVYAYEEYGTMYRGKREWQFNGVCADMLGVPIIDMRGRYIYEPHEYEPETVQIKKGESVWLSEFFDGYDIVRYADPVHFQAVIEVSSGIVDMDTAALRHNGKLGDRSSVPDNIGFGIYRYDYTVKGIADTLPQVETDTLRYTVDDSDADGTILPGTVYNQYSPEGVTVENWCSNINPVSDYWSKTIAVESDMIKLEYADDNKYTYYGSNVTERDNIWRFDTRHTSVSSYQSISGRQPDDYSPNFEVEDIYLDGIEPYACNLGNYGVIETYNLEVTNSGSRDRYFEYNVQTSSDVIVYAADGSGSFDKAYSKGVTNEAVFTPMASVLLPAGETTVFTVNMFIPVNVNGGIQNRFIIRDAYNVKAEPYKERNYVKPMRGRRLSEVRDKLSAGALAEFGSNLDSYEINSGDGLHLVRWRAWDGNTYFYKNTWDNCNTVYVLDENYEIIHTYKLPTMPNEADIADGVLYVRDEVNGVYASYDGGASWSQPGIELIPVSSGFTDNIGRIETVTVTDNNGSVREYKADLPEYDEYIAGFEMSRSGGREFKDRKYESVVINGVYSAGSGMDMGDGTRYVLPEDDEKWLLSEIANCIFKHNSASAWSKDHLDKAFGYGIVPVYMRSDDKAFTEPLTRLEFCDLIYEMLEIMDSVPAPSAKMFSDCDDERVRSLAAAGIITGVTDTEFMPDGGITREQAAAVLARTARFMDTAPASTAVYIRDEVSDWARESVYMMYNAGIMNGIGGGDFDAYGGYTKEQSITAQARLYEYILCADAYGRLPSVPGENRYYAVYFERYRSGRIELTEFGVSDGIVPKIVNGDILTIENESAYTADRKYSLSCGQWIPFEKDYIRISNMSGGLIITNAQL